MKAQGNFKFKGLEKKDAGTFTNPNGQNVNYPAKYILKVDEITNEGVNERLFRVPIDSTILPHLINRKLYEDVTLEFDIKFSSNNSISIIPINVIK